MVYIRSGMLNNHINCFMCDIITQPCPTFFNIGLNKLALQLGHAWVITSLISMWIWLPCYSSTKMHAGLANFMKTSSNGNIVRVTDHLCGEFTDQRWIPHTKASDAEVWCFLWSAPEYTVEKTMVKLVIWDGIAPIMTSLQCVSGKEVLGTVNSYFLIVAGRCRI